MAPKAIDYGTYKQILKQGNRVSVLPDVYYNQLPQDLRRIAFTVSGITRATAIQDVLSSLQKAEADKVDFNDWIEQFNLEDFMKLTESHRETVYRTNMTTQYNNGRLQVAMDDNNDLNYLKYQAVLDDKTRPNHAANDGVVLPADDPFWDTNTPPLGYNCRCIVLNIDRKDLKDNPLTPQSDLDASMEPDPGFESSVKDPEPEITKIFKERARELPPIIRAAATEFLLGKSKDQKAWWKNNKKDFVKEE